MKLKEVTTNMSSGSTPSRKNLSFWESKDIKWLKTQEINMRYLENTLEYVDKKSKIKTNNINDIVIAMYGETRGKVSILKSEMATNQACCVIRCDEKKVHYMYLYYLFVSKYNELYKMGNGGAQQNLSVSLLKELEIDLPSIEEQKEIADKISVYDDKIENNNKIINTLEEMASLLYKRYFVDFEFPNNEGKPYKSNGGEFKDSEIGLIPIEWSIKKITDYIDVVTGKKNANAAVENGKYKFFTCSQKDFSTNEYCFEGNAIIIAGNGDFSVKKYNGKFDAYQRTYVLIPENEDDVDWLYWHIKINLDEITSGHRGSVIKFITKGMITEEIVLESKNSKIKDQFKDINNYIQSLKQENEILTTIRDLLISELIK